MKELLNTLKPLKLSYSDNELSKLTTLISSITDQFKFNCIDYDERIELKDYVIPSLNYINKHLVLVDSSDIFDKIDGFVDIMEHINDAIIEKNCGVICKDLEYNYDEFDLIYFTYLWTSLTTNMLVRLKYNYGWKRKKPEVSVQWDCDHICPPCPCSSDVPQVRPIQESYYTKWNSNDSYLERY